MKRPATDACQVRFTDGEADKKGKIAIIAAAIRVRSPMIRSVPTVISTKGRAFKKPPPMFGEKLHRIRKMGLNESVEPVIKLQNARHDEEQAKRYAAE